MENLSFIFFTVLQSLIIIVCILISVAYFTLAERKILASIQRRRGPNVVGTYGLLQPLADGFKLLTKEVIIPSSSNKWIFILAPVMTFAISLVAWSIIPFDNHSTLAEIDLGLLCILGMSGVGIYGIIFSGWSSNSKYPLLGALRSTAQMVSYEVSLGFIILPIGVLCESFCLNEIVIFQENIWFVIPYFPLFLMFFISGLAETNRHPFDLPEAESELVSGYNVEYSAMPFALFSLAEYSNMLVMSSLNVILFFGGWLPFSSILSFIPGYVWFSIKVCFFVYLFILMRGILPRYRYDQLMYLGWKVLLPVSISYLLFTFGLAYGFDIYNS
jgi:NADH-quinone oxidoreductase subunit H